jgi:adenylate kinase family enzyme
MMTTRIHITGASGTGTSTLGAALAEGLGVAHLDTDDYYWIPTDPPFEHPRPPTERLARLKADLDSAGAAKGWVLSGSLCGWGDPLIGRFELVVFLFLAQEVRLARLRDREYEKFGEAALAPGGRQHANHVAFLEWAAGYDEGDLDMRSLTRHSLWLDTLPCPVARFEEEMAVTDLLEGVLRMPKKKENQ